MHDHLVAERIKLTYEDFCALPDDGKRYEILDGDLYMSPSPNTVHQRIVGRLYSILDDHARKKGLGEAFVAPFDVVLDEHDVVVPDVSFVSKAKQSIITEANIQGAPDLIVEVLSPSTKSRDTRDKRNVYARSGVDWYRIIDPEKKSVLELRLVDNAYAVVSETKDPLSFCPELFPDLRIDLPELWE